jgi:hypothetical protein
MKKNAPNEFRVRNGIFDTDDSDGMKGMFLIPVDGDDILVTCNVGGKEMDHLTLGSRGKVLTEQQKEKVKRYFWDDDELEDLFEFDPSDILPIKLNSNTVHIKKRTTNWKTYKI